MARMAKGEEGIPGASDNDDLTINLKALEGVHPSEPRPDSKAALVVSRLSGLALAFCLGAWVLFVVAEFIARLVSSTPGQGLQRLVLGSLGALAGGVVVFFAIRSKQHDREEASEPSRVMGVAWSTRFLLAGFGFMVIGAAMFWSVR
jgi:hypothetical protein